MAAARSGPNDNAAVTGIPPGPHPPAPARGSARRRGRAIRAAPAAPPRRAAPSAAAAAGSARAAGRAAPAPGPAPPPRRTAARPGRGRAPSGRPRAPPRRSTISAARRPKGGQPPGRRVFASSAMKASRSPETSACITGWSGLKLCSSTRPGASARPARPATWCRSCTVRSAARRSPPARPRSASTTPTRVRCGKCQPLATICVPMMRSTSRSWMARAASAAAAGPGMVSDAMTAAAPPARAAPPPPGCAPRRGRPG